MRHRIAHDWKEAPSVVVESLEEAVQLASKKGHPGTTVLFSPGTSSFDMFRDYVQRGEMYRRLVEQLPS
jgi:UDP-N-acetylmuramoylalanine--D-glutamate ligase